MQITAIECVPEAYLKHEGAHIKDQHIALDVGGLR